MTAIHFCYAMLRDDQLRRQASSSKERPNKRLYKEQRAESFPLAQQSQIIAEEPIGPLVQTRRARSASSLRNSKDWGQAGETAARITKRHSSKVEVISTDSLYFSVSSIGDVAIDPTEAIELKMASPKPSQEVFSEDETSSLLVLIIRTSPYF